LFPSRSNLLVKAEVKFRLGGGIVFDIYIRVSRLGERTEDEATEVYEEQCLRVKDRLSLEIDEIVDETNVGGSVEVADRELERASIWSPRHHRPHLSEGRPHRL
jgi:hypothetical protein